MAFFSLPLFPNNNLYSRFLRNLCKYIVKIKKKIFSYLGKCQKSSRTLGINISRTLLSINRLISMKLIDIIQLNNGKRIKQRRGEGDYDVTMNVISTMQCAFIDNKNNKLWKCSMKIFIAPPPFVFYVTIAIKK